MAGFGLVICIIVALACAGTGPCVAQPASEPSGTQDGSSSSAPPAPRGLFVRRPQPVPDIKSLTVAVWSMPELPHAKGDAHRPDEPHRHWRNTFGAERRSEAWRWLGPAGLDADIILLQGIVDVGTVRRLFGARTHILVISRQILVRPRKTAGVTGVVIRRRRGLGISNVQHIWWRPRRFPLPPNEAMNALPSAITAVRLRAGHRQIWVASVAAGSGCKSATPDKAGGVSEAGNVTPEFRCQGMQGLREFFAGWLGQLPPEDDDVILAGTGAVAELVANRDVRFVRLTHAADQCGERSPQIGLLRRTARDRATGPATKHPTARQPSLGEAQGSPKRKCALLADVELVHK